MKKAASQLPFLLFQASCCAVVRDPDQQVFGHDLTAGADASGFDLGVFFVDASFHLLRLDGSRQIACFYLRSDSGIHGRITSGIGVLVYLALPCELKAVFAAINGSVLPRTAAERLGHLQLLRPSRPHPVARQVLAARP